MTSTKQTFHQTGKFKALGAAQEWCKDHDFSYGPLCGSEPVAIMHGRVTIAKWRNLSKVERSSIDGKMTSPDFRNGPVMVEIF